MSAPPLSFRRRKLEISWRERSEGTRTNNFHVRSVALFLLSYGSYSLKVVISPRSVVLSNLEAALFELFHRTAGAEIVSAQLLMQFLVTSDNSSASLDSRFGWKPLATFADDLVERALRFRFRSFSYSPPGWLKLERGGGIEPPDILPAVYGHRLRRPKREHLA